MSLEQNFEQRAAEVSDTLPRVPDSFLCMSDVQQYVRMWEQSHILATFTIGDTLLECVVRAKYGGPKMYISSVNWHPVLIKVLIGEQGFLLPEQLSRVHRLWMSQRRLKDTDGISVKAWIAYCEQMIVKGNRS